MEMKMEEVQPKTTLENLPNEMYHEVFKNISSISDFRNCRLVCVKWKNLLSYGYPVKFSLVYPLTSSTLYDASSLTENPLTLDVFALSSKEHQNAWSTSEIEEMLKNLQSLQFSGSQLEKEDIQKMCGCAKDAVQWITFKSTLKNIVGPFLEMKEKFTALRGLEIGYFSNKNENDTFRSFTTVLESWSSDNCKAELPGLESLKLYFNGKGTGNAWRPVIVTITSEDLFRNYLAVGKVLLKYRRSLRDVHIERFRRQGFPSLSRADYERQQQWTERRKPLEQLGELRLRSLKICTLTDDINRRRQALTSTPSEFEASGSLANLREVLFEMLMCPQNNSQMLTGTLSSMNVQSDYLTSVRIGITLTENRDRVLGVNLGVFRRCRQLRKLQLMILPKRSADKLAVRNVDGLPRGLTSFHVEFDEKLGDNLGSQLLLNRGQIGWIIENLRELESIQLCLGIQEGQGGGRGNGATDMTNIDLLMFGRLITMPKLKTAHVGIMRGRCLGVAVSRNWEAALVIPFTEFQDVQEYKDLCEREGLKTVVKPTTNLGFSAYGYAKLSIKKN